MASKTFNVTQTQIQQMINEQRKMQAHLENKETDDKAIALSFYSVGTTILSLVFWQVAASSIALGVVSFITGATANTLNATLNAAYDGERALLRISNTMKNLGATSANITCGYRVLGSGVHILESASTNYMKKGDITITG